ncbi:MAG: TPM domain-containing protein, partial [Oscillospiraceae bacterium]|nr:TPM domain-containing protein [Oscillospiraceae bacterium]
MKRVFTLLLAVLLTAACAVTALAEPYDTSYYLVNDYCELLEEEEVETLDEKACEALVDLKFDFPICLVELEGEQDIEDFAEWFYEGFGYGDEHDGILLTIDFSQYEYILTPVGRGELIFDDETLDKLDEATLEALTDEDKTWAESLDAYLDAAIAIVAASDIAPSAGTETPPDTTTPSVGGGAPTKTQENGGTAAAPSVGAQAPQ